MIQRARRHEFEPNSKRRNSRIEGLPSVTG